MRAEPTSATTKKFLFLGFFVPRSSKSWDTTTKYFFLLTVSSQVSWMGGCGCLVTRVLRSVEVYDQGSEVIFQDSFTWAPYLNQTCPELPPVPWLLTLLSHVIS